MPLRSLAAVLLLVAATLAPWLAGANVAIPWVGWLLASLLATSFLLVLASSVLARRPPQISPWTFVPATFLIGCVGWWAGQPAPTFATPFSAEHWRFLETNLAAFILEWPRTERLAFFAGTLFGFLAVIELGRSARFRRQLCAVLGLSGLTIALWSLGIRWFGWATPDWIDLAGDTERFNVAFFHHNAPGGALNLAWPLLFFGAVWPSTGRLGLGARITLLLIVAATLPLWHSKTALAIAAGLLLAALAWPRLASRLRRPRATLFAVIFTVFISIFAVQSYSVQQLRRTHPDGWISAAQTQLTAPARDAIVIAAADRRRDRLVVSTAPSRPAAWLTALRMTRDYPLIGLGPGAWLTHATLYSHDTTVGTFYQNRQFAHHDLLQTAAEWGGLAALAALALWIGALWRATRPDPAAPVAEPGLLLALIGMALLSLVHFPLQNPALLLWTLLLLGLAWSRPADNTDA